MTTIQLLTGSALVALSLVAVMPAHAQSSSVEITRAEYGDAKWPFTIDTGTLRCTNGAVTLEHKGLRYPLNGTARMVMKQQPKLGFRDSKEILKPGGSLLALIERGLSLCKKGGAQ
jgi:hypothetical protein